MIKITAAEVNKLRQATGAGMMDCKKALVEAEGDFDKAIDNLRKKGQKVAANRADRDSSEGAAVAKINDDNTVGVTIVLGCETSRISSRFNLKRRIAYYGNKVRPHKGTDFAAPIGTPILATANGTVTESTRKGGNGKYVKIRHNATYSTQYLHMSKRLVKVGDYVKQGDVIGKVGMTGNTGGPHVCYRFWKNGRQVDPLRQKLPDAKALSPDLKPDFQAFIAPLKQQLDSIN